MSYIDMIEVGFCMQSLVVTKESMVVLTRMLK